jgi:hypothetical protein
VNKVRDTDKSSLLYFGAEQKRNFVKPVDDRWWEVTRKKHDIARLVEEVVQFRNKPADMVVVASQLDDFDPQNPRTWVTELTKSVVSSRHTSRHDGDNQG